MAKFMPLSVLFFRSDAEITGYALDAIYNVVSNEPSEEGTFLLQCHESLGIFAIKMLVSLIRKSCSCNLYCYVPGVTRRLRKPTSWLASNKLCLKFNKSI